MQKGAIELLSDGDITTLDGLFEFLRSKISKRQKLISVFNHHYL